MLRRLPFTPYVTQPPERRLIHPPQYHTRRKHASEIEASGISLTEGLTFRSGAKFLNRVGPHEQFLRLKLVTTNHVFTHQLSSNKPRVDLLCSIEDLSRHWDLWCRPGTH